jgi:hypothetical protein
VWKLGGGWWEESPRRCSSDGGGNLEGGSTGRPYRKDTLRILPARNGYKRLGVYVRDIAAGEMKGAGEDFYNTTDIIHAVRGGGSRRGDRERDGVCGCIRRASVSKGTGWIRNQSKKDCLRDGSTYSGTVRRLWVGPLAEWFNHRTRSRCPGLFWTDCNSAKLDHGRGVE